MFVSTDLRSLEVPSIQSSTTVVIIKPTGNTH
jgi:hypothetical protein